MSNDPFDILNQIKVEPSDDKRHPKPSARKIIPLTDQKLAVDKGLRGQTPRFSSKTVPVFRLEDDFPTVDEARRILRLEFEQQRRQGSKLLKVIHGYGSTGRGGALGDAMPELLTEFCNLGAITSFVLGNDFSCFSPKSSELISKYKHLKKDRDYGNQNRGISIVEL